MKTGKKTIIIAMICALLIICSVIIFKSREPEKLSIGEYNYLSPIELVYSIDNEHKASVLGSPVYILNENLDFSFLDGQNENNYLGLMEKTTITTVSDYIHIRDDNYWTDSYSKANIINNNDYVLHLENEGIAQIYTIFAQKDNTYILAKGIFDNETKEKYYTWAHQVIIKTKNPTK